MTTEKMMQLMKSKLKIDLIFTYKILLKRFINLIGDVTGKLFFLHNQ